MFTQTATQMSVVSTDTTATPSSVGANRPSMETEPTRMIPRTHAYLRATFLGLALTLIAAGAASAVVDNTYAVGVVPVDGTTCPADSQLVTIYMDDEDDDNNTDWVGYFGNDGGKWQSPQTPFRGVREGEDICSIFGCTRFNENTTLRFCKVNGQKFKPLTTNVNAKSQFYAVLKLGQYCPNGSLNHSRFIDNEDDDNENWTSGPIAPNSQDHNTSLKFCFFRTGTSSNLMTSFPSLGIQYAVFHDYDDSIQPSWVISKRWHYSDNEDDDNINSSSPSGTSAAYDFGRLVGSGTNTFFEFARVK